MEPKEIYQQIHAEMKKYIAGKDDTIELLVVAMVANGHALLEGVPGTAKTTMTKILAATINADFKRIQGTPDLEPRDIRGYTFIDEKGEIQVRKGPVFTNILLIDELNRTPPKTMSALLETLEERQVTFAGEDLLLPKPFIAYATQNPLTIEGTEPLPKVLADRFLMKIDVDYPSMQEEQEMIRIKEKDSKSAPQRIVEISTIMELQEKAKGIRIPDDVVVYITQLIDGTRKDIHVVMGASPRADIAFMQCGKAKALIEGRDTVTKEDIKFLAKPVLTHRIAVRATGGLGVKGIVDGIISSVR